MANKAAPTIPASFPNLANTNGMFLETWKACFLKLPSITSVKILPAFETPPPIINTSGSTTVEINAAALPIYSPTSLTTFIANSSPALAASKTSLAVISANSSKLLLTVPKYSLAKRTTPVAEATVSKQPTPPPFILMNMIYLHMT